AIQISGQRPGKQKTPGGRFGAFEQEAVETRPGFGDLRIKGSGLTGVKFSPWSSRCLPPSNNGGSMTTSNQPKNVFVNRYRRRRFGQIEDVRQHFRSPPSR